MQNLMKTFLVQLILMWKKETLKKWDRVIQKQSFESILVKKNVLEYFIKIFKFAWDEDHF